jgi:MoaA/NifB/PqqE/SkfB family radical SAM enzyme
MNVKEYIAFFKSVMRVVRECPLRLVWKFVYTFGWKSMLNIRRFEKRIAKGKPFFPAFLMISVTERCNLVCSGCWVSVGGKKALTTKQLDGIITLSKQQGSFFFGILGGEPLLYDGLLDIIQKHSDCYFQLFTNGLLLTDEVAQRLRRSGNVTPLISIEGLQEESDVRRGGKGVFDKSLSAVRACKRAGLIFGVSASICNSNYDDLVSRNYIDFIAREGAHYLWYYLYRPVGVVSKPENALTHEQVLSFRRFIVEQRRDAPLLLIETYWDAQGKALCPGATGMSHHISPSGALEFCPPLQMAADFLNDEGSNLAQLFAQSNFLSSLRTLTASTSRGCILLEDPALLVDFLTNGRTHDMVMDTTSRQTVIEEYRRMTSLPSHSHPCEEIPEQNPFYRFLKKKYFFGFGAYG